MRKKSLTNKQRNGKLSLVYSRSASADEDGFYSLHQENARFPISHLGVLLSSEEIQTFEQKKKAWRPEYLAPGLRIANIDEKQKKTSAMTMAVFETPLEFLNETIERLEVMAFNGRAERRPSLLMESQLENLFSRLETWIDNIHLQNHVLHGKLTLKQIAVYALPDSYPVVFSDFDFFKPDEEFQFLPDVDKFQLTTDYDFRIWNIMSSKNIKSGRFSSESEEEEVDTTLQRAKEVAGCCREILTKNPLFLVYFSAKLLTQIMVTLELESNDHIAGFNFSDFSKIMTFKTEEATKKQSLRKTIFDFVRKKGKGSESIDEEKTRNASKETKKKTPKEKKKKTTKKRT